MSARLPMIAVNPEKVSVKIKMVWQSNHDINANPGIINKVYAMRVPVPVSMCGSMWRRPVSRSRFINTSPYHRADTQRKYAVHEIAPVHRLSPSSISAQLNPRPNQGTANAFDRRRATLPAKAGNRDTKSLINEIMAMTGANKMLVSMCRSQHDVREAGPPTSAFGYIRSCTVAKITSALPSGTNIRAQQKGGGTADVAWPRLKNLSFD